MRIRTQLIIADDVLAKIDEIAGEKHRRAFVVETALREYIEREDARPKKKVTKVADKKSAPKRH